jgi:hypothetical protein
MKRDLIEFLELDNLLHNILEDVLGRSLVNGEFVTYAENFAAFANEIFKIFVSAYNKNIETSQVTSSHVQLSCP